MEFTPINTQEEFDSRVKELYGDVNDLQGRITTLTGERDAHADTIAQLQTKVKGYEMTALKAKIAKEKGIPAEMADRLTGEDEKGLRADADTMAANLRAFKGAAPLHNPEPAEPDANTAGMKTMLSELRGE
ncbi:MAG: DUF4355 domain-containing protein [Oscillospiraceae bacterium]|nr:DUF4355 domain-containing protein [Oscillospiraceae bacterium]